MSVTPDDGRTHWHGCEREHGHHACALAEIDRLRAEADAERICALELRAQLDRVNATAIQRKDELTRLRAELERARRLIAAAVFNDLSDMAADGVTVGMLWQKDALAFLSALAQEPPA